MNHSSGKRLTHEEVVNRLDDETVSYDSGLGVSTYFSELLRVSIKVEPNMYQVAIQWLKDLLYHAEFDKERYVVINDRKQFLRIAYWRVLQTSRCLGQDPTIHGRDQA